MTLRNDTAVAFEDVRQDKTSVAIKELAERARGRDVTVGEILAALKDRGFGVFMILFALPNAVIPVHRKQGHGLRLNPAGKCWTRRMVVWW